MSGGVFVFSFNWGTFIKQPGAIIYGSDADDTLKNTAQSGYAAFRNNREIDKKQRNSTAGTEVTLDSSIDGSDGGWEE
jgi:hypothetical protein